MGLFSRKTAAEPLAAELAEVESLRPLRAVPEPEELTAHWPELMRHARRLMGNASDAQDLLQDTFERAVRGLDRFQPGTNLRAWLYTIMVRRATDQFRAARVRLSHPLELDSLPAASVVLDDREEALEERPWMRVTAEQFRSAVAALPQKYREIFQLHEVQHLPYQDIAARLDIPVNTVATRLYRARQKLGVLLNQALEREGRA